MNPLLGPFLELRANNLTFREIGEQFGVTGSYVRTLVRKPPKFIKGHSAKLQQWVTKTCPGCGESFRTTPAGRSYCMSRYCKGSVLRSDAHAEFIERLDRAEALRSQEMREATALEYEIREQADSLLTVPARLEERRAQRKLNIAAARAWIRQGLAPWWHAPSEREVTYEFEGELRELVERQARDMKWEDRAGLWWMFPLDAPLRSAKDHSDLYGLTGHDWIEAPNSDPFDAIVADEAASELASILGVLDMEKLARMDDYTREHLQERLREAGHTPTGIQRKERERLRQPQRNRGGAPPVDHSRMSTKHKHRKPGHQKSAGSKRGSRKPKRRWTRDDAMEYAA